jgi:glucosamine 6-phosphate synthetase-like amidotransferase/phosphosugar isomerase protein
MCALFGIYDYRGCFNSRKKEIILSVLSQGCETRGTDATGISYLKDGKLQVYKRPVPAREMKYNIPSEVKTIMGHTRMTTQGSEKHNYNNHPFFGRVKKNTFTLAHNGILQNDKELRQSMKLPKTNIETDSYIAVQIIEKENSVSFGSLKKVAETVQGSFVFTVLDNKDNLYFVRGENPICVYHFIDNGFYLYASTEGILMRAIIMLGLNNKYNYKSVPVEVGDILRIDGSGSMKTEQFTVTESSHSQYGYQYQYPVCVYKNYDNYDNQTYELEEKQYLSSLKQISGLYGYTPENIDELVAEGWSLEEIEQILYEDNMYCETMFEY